MPNEYAFSVTYQNKFTGTNRHIWINIFADCEADAFKLCLNEAYKQIHSYEGLYKIDLIYVI